jgi:hypothetical protein
VGIKCRITEEQIVCTVKIIPSSVVETASYLRVVEGDFRATFYRAVSHRGAGASGLLGERIEYDEHLIRLSVGLDAGASLGTVSDI